MLLDGPMAEYVSRDSANRGCIKPCIHGDIVVMDSLNSHKTVAART